MLKLEEITRKNVWDVVYLSVKDDQQYFLPNNGVSLIEAFSTMNEGKNVKPFAVYNDDDLIGFVMIGKGSVGKPINLEVIKDNYILWRFMIDKEWQGKGFAPQILQAVVDYVKTFPFGPAENIVTAYFNNNERAEKIYKQFGFVDNGDTIGDEVIAVRKL